MKKGFGKWIIIGIIAIIIIGAIAGSKNDETSNTPTNIEYIKVSKDDLDKALKNNAAAAKDTYNGKYLEVTGKLGTIDSDLKYISLMSSTNKYDFNGIFCRIKNSEQKDIIKTLTKDQKLTIKGKVTDVGEVLGYYMDIIEIVK